MELSSWKVKHEHKCADQARRWLDQMSPKCYPRSRSPFATESDLRPKTVASKNSLSSEKLPSSMKIKLGARNLLQAHHL